MSARLRIQERRALAIIVSYVVSTLLVTKVLMPHVIERSRAVQVLRRAGSALTQLYLGANPPKGPLGVRVVLLTRNSVDDHPVAATHDRVLDQSTLLKVLARCEEHGAKAILLDYDLGARADELYRDPEGEPRLGAHAISDREFLDSLRASALRPPGGASRSLPIAVGISQRAFAPPGMRLGEPRFDFLAVMLALPHWDDLERGGRQVAELRVAADGVPSAGLWVARKLNPSTDSLLKVVRPGWQVLTTEPLDSGGSEGHGEPGSSDSVRLFVPDYSTVPRLVGETLVLDDLDDGPKWEVLRDQVVLISHRELDPYAPVEGVPSKDERLRRVHLLAAGAITLAQGPLRTPTPAFESQIDLAFTLLGLVLCLVASGLLLAHRREPTFFEKLDLPLSLVVAGVLVLVHLLGAARWRMVLDHRLVVAPLIVLGSYLNGRIVHGVRIVMKGQAHGDG